MTDRRSLYEADFALWSAEQAEAIRSVAAAGANLPLDWDNLAEEIESLGRSQRTELRSRLATIIEHLLKLEFSPAREPRRTWIDTVERERRDVDFLLSDSPSLRQALDDLADSAIAPALRSACRSLDRHGELRPGLEDAMARRRFTSDELLGTWIPDQVGSHSPH